MTLNPPLHIQRLDSYVDQTLVLAHVAQLRSQDRTISPRGIEDTFLNLRIPLPSNVSQNLAILSKRGLMLRLAPGRWALTPEGKEAIRQLMAGVKDSALREYDTPGSEALLGDAPHYLLSPDLAPAKFQSGISRFREGHPFERNVFLISRSPRDEADPVGPAIETCRSACEDAGMEMHVATDRAVEELLFGNIAAAMWACQYAVALFEDHRGEGVNTNVALEVGGMLITGRQCLLLKDDTVERLPTDLVGHLYQPVDITNHNALSETVTRWLGSDLGLAD